MKTIIQTKNRIVSQIITDVDVKDYDAIKKLLVEQNVPMDGFLIECNSKIGYVWLNKKRPVEPLFPPDAIIA